MSTSPTTARKAHNPSPVAENVLTPRRDCSCRAACSWSATVAYRASIINRNPSSSARASTRAARSATPTATCSCQTGSVAPTSSCQTGSVAPTSSAWTRAAWTASVGVTRPDSNPSRSAASAGLSQAISARRIRNDSVRVTPAPWSVNHAAVDTDPDSRTVPRLVAWSAHDSTRPRAAVSSAPAWAATSARSSVCTCPIPSTRVRTTSTRPGRAWDAAVTSR